MLNLNLILCSLVSTDYFKIFVTTRKKIFFSLRIGIYISYSCVPITVLKSNILLGTKDETWSFCPGELGFLRVRNPQPEMCMFVTWFSGAIPWSSATHMELGTWVSLSRAGVPKLIASSFCFSQDSSVGKSEVLRQYFVQHKAEGKGNILTLGSVKTTVLSLPCDINYLPRLQIRLIRVFLF